MEVNRATQAQTPTPAGRPAAASAAAPQTGAPQSGAPQSGAPTETFTPAQADPMEEARRLATMRTNGGVAPASAEGLQAADHLLQPGQVRRGQINYGHQADDFERTLTQGGGRRVTPQGQAVDAAGQPVRSGVPSSTLEGITTEHYQMPRNNPQGQPIEGSFREDFHSKTTFDSRWNRETIGRLNDRLFSGLPSEGNTTVVQVGDDYFVRKTQPNGDSKLYVTQERPSGATVHPRDASVLDEFPRRPATAPAARPGQADAPEAPRSTSTPETNPRPTGVPDAPDAPPVPRPTPVSAAPEGPAGAPAPPARGTATTETPAAPPRSNAPASRPAAPVAATPAAAQPAAAAPPTPAPRAGAQTGPTVAGESAAMRTVRVGGGVLGVGLGGVQAAQGVQELRQGNVVDGVADTAGGALNVAGGAALVAGSTVAAPVALAGAAGLDAGRTIIRGVQNGDGEQIATGGAKALGAGMMGAAPFVTGSIIGAPVGVALGVGGAVVYGAASVYENRQVIGQAIGNAATSVRDTVGGWISRIW